MDATVQGMAGNVPEIGVKVACPVCGEVVFQKSMIPVLDGDGPAHKLICTTCARKLVVKQPG